MAVFLDEKTEVIELRRSQSILEICGKGTFILILWSFAKFLLSVNVEDKGVAYMQENMAGAGGMSSLRYWSIFLALAAVVIAVHAFVAFQAIAESRGKKRGYFYLAVCVLLMISSLWSALDVFISPEEYSSVLDLILNLCLEIMSIAVESCVIIHSIKIKKLRRLSDGEGR